MKFSRSIRTKILAYCICIALIPTSVIFFYTLQSNAKAYTDQIETITDQTVRDTARSIGWNVKSVSLLESSLLFSQYEGQSVLLSVCGQERAGASLSAYARLQNQRKFEYVCSNLISNNAMVEAVYLFPDSGYTYSFTKNTEFWLGDTAADEGWRAQLTGGRSTCVQPFTPEHSEDGNRYILFAKKFYNLAGKATGTLAVVCNRQVLEQNEAAGTDSAVLFPDGTSLGLTSGGGANLSAGQLAQIGTRESGYIDSGDSQSVIAFGTLKDLGWKVVSRVSLRPFYTAYRRTKLYFICFMAAVLCVVLALVYRLDRGIVRPLVQLSRLMNDPATLRAGSFRNAYPDRRDEIGILYGCFERMLNRIHRLIDEKYKGEIRYLKSRLQNLTSQINSHFLFNTLENINDCALIAHNDEIAVMSKSLGDILRYSIDCETDEVPLSAELEQAEKYLSIQKIKFGHDIRFRTEIGEGLADRPVMKFFLQPIIENAVEHGMSGETPNAEIVLRAFRRGPLTCLTIYDNGDSIPEERLRDVRLAIASDGKPGGGERHTGVGLRNVRQRLKLMYPGRGDLRIRNAEEGGVVVEVLVPYEREERRG